MSATALVSLAQRFTLPYRRGAEAFPIPLGADAGNVTEVAAYDFAEYRARYGVDPATPSYVLIPLGDIAGDDVIVTVTYQYHGAPAIATVTIPGGTFAGKSFIIPIPAGADGTLRLTSLAPVPTIFPPPGAKQWVIYALLGVTAKVTWLLAREKDALRHTIDDVRKQRFVESAHGAGLDAIGADLRVPRFPPRPYSIDAQTVALWHLDDAIANGGTVVDAGTIPAVAAGHPGTLSGGASGAAGKYGSGFIFSGTGTDAVLIPASPAFDITATADATIEAFVKPAIPADGVPRIVVGRRASETTAPLTAPGWSLSVVNARGFDANVMFAVCDGTHELKLYADLGIADGRFHHIAGIIDRSRTRVRIFVDGTQRATSASDLLGAVAPPDSVRIGSSAAGNALSGTVDEVRISSVARTTFHPVLGEDDEAYRARLRIFRRWMLPSPGNLAVMVNEAAPLPTDLAPYELIESNRLTAVGEAVVNVVPASIGPGGAIDANGKTLTDEADVAGTIADEPTFDPQYLLTYASAAVDTSAANASRMQAVTASVLDALVVRIATLGIAGQLVIEKAYDPADTTSLHGVGRALLVHHTAATLGPGVLAALAYRVGFTFVKNLGPHVYMSVAQGERLAIRIAPPATARVGLGTSLDLTIAPSLSSAGVFAWTVITAGPGAAHFVAHPLDPPTLKTSVATRPRLRLITDAPGDIGVRVEYTLSGRTVSGTLPIRIDATTLADGHAIDAQGNQDPIEANVVAPPEAGFDPNYLFMHPDAAAIDFSASPDTKRMQLAARDALDALVALLTAHATPGRIVVVKGYDANDMGLHHVGRSLQLRHETLDAGTLGALAVQSFDYVSRSGTTIEAAVGIGSLVAIGDPTTTLPIPSELVVGTPVHLGAIPATLPAGGTYNWSVRTIGNGSGSFDSFVRPTATFTPATAGKLVLDVVYVAKDDAHAAPYTFELRLKNALDVPATIIPKYQYDIIMNILDAYHPIGVEVRTDRIRAHVPEVEQDPAKAFPAYSFPNFRF